MAAPFLPLSGLVDAAERAPTQAGTGEEERLLAELAAGNREAAESLVELTYRKIYGALFRLCGNEDLAADLTQETYRRAWSSMSSFEGRAQFSTWLYRIAYTTFLNHVRRPRIVLPMADELAETLPSDEPSPESTLAGRGEDERLRRAVLALPEPLRSTVTSRYWGELPVQEIARAESITPVAVRKRLYKAFELLQRALGGTSP